MFHIYRQITALRRWRPVVICQKREERERFPFDEDALEIIPKPITSGLRRLWVRQIRKRPVMIYRSEARRIAQAIQRVNGQVLHVYFGNIAVLLLPLLREAPVPIIVSFHGADAGVEAERPAYVAAIREVLGLARLVLARSEALAERIVTMGCPREKIRIHRTGIPLERFPFQARTAPADGAWRFFQACRLIPKKGLHTTLRAFARFAEKFPLASFTVAGEGPLLDELTALAAELGIAEKVRFTGFLTHKELLEQLVAAHVFLHPSETGPDGNQEGVPNSMLEAMSTGLPVVATWHGGIPEAVDDGVSGFLVNERDPEALAEALFKLADNPARYAKMCPAAAQSVAERFEQSRQIEVLDICYDEAAKASMLKEGMEIYYVTVEVTFRKPLELLDENNKPEGSIIGFYQSMGCTAKAQAEMQAMVIEAALAEYQDNADVRFDYIGEIKIHELDREVYGDEDIPAALKQDPRYEGIWYTSGRGFYYEE
jgi:glycosyltransferase involved in cell wall biosynthesis